MVKIKHGSYGIKSEAIESVFFLIPGQVRQQEPQDFIFRVIEELAIPQSVEPFRTCMKVLVIGSVKFIYSIIFVSGGVAES